VVIIGPDRGPDQVRSAKLWRVQDCVGKDVSYFARSAKSITGFKRSPCLRLRIYPRPRSRSTARR